MSNWLEGGSVTFYEKINNINILTESRFDWYTILEREKYRNSY